MCTGQAALQRAGLHHRAMSAGRYHVLSGQRQVFGQRKPSTRMFWQAVAYGERRSGRRKGRDDVGVLPRRELGSGRHKLHRQQAAAKLTSRTSR